MGVVPGNFNYSDNTGDPDLPKYEVTVAGRRGVLNNPGYEAIVKAKKRVAQYINIVDVNPPWTEPPLSARFCVGAPALNLSNWGGYKIVDLSNAAWRAKLNENLKWLVSLPGLTDVFSDVHGERLWSPAWNSMSAAQRDTFAKYMEEIGYQWGDIRDQYRPEAYLWFNGTWHAGHKAACPVIEHHSLSEKPSWVNYVDPVKWDPKAQGGAGAAFFIAFNLSEAQQWATVRGTGPIAAQSTYDQAPSSALPYAALKPRTGAVNPPPTTPPPTTTLPKPTIPKNIKAVPGPQDGSALITWDANPTADKVDKYQVYNDDALIRDDITTTSHTVLADPGKQLNLRVSAHNASGYGDWSPVLPFMVPNVTPEPEPEPEPAGNPELEAFQEIVREFLATTHTSANAMLGRLTTVLRPDNPEWKNLTKAQRTSLTAVKNRAEDITKSIDEFTQEALS